MLDTGNGSSAALFCENIKRTIYTASTFDFSFNLPIIGTMMPLLGYKKAAATTTTMLDALMCLQLGAVLPSSFELGRLFGELEELEKPVEQKLLTVANKSSDSNTAGAALKPQDIAITVRQPEEAKLSDPTQVAINLETDKVAKIAALKIKISRTPKNGAIVGSIICVLNFITMLFADPILSLLGQDKDVSAPAQTFLRCYAGFYLLISLLRFEMEFVVLATKRLKAAMAIAGSLLLLTVGLQYALAFHTFLGLAGLGIGAGIGSVLVGLGYLIYVTRAFKDFGFWKHSCSYIPSDAEQICRFAKESILTTLTMASEVLIPLVLSLIAGMLSGDAAIMWNLAAQYLNITTWILAASRQTTAMMVSEQRGKAKAGKAPYNVVKRAAMVGLLVTVILQLPLAIFVSSFPTVFSNIVGVPIRDESECRHLMLATVGYGFIDGLCKTILQTTRSLGDNAKPALISTSLFWLSVGLSYTLCQYTSLGILGLPLGLYPGAFLGLLLIVNRLPQSLHAAALQDNREHAPHQAIEPVQNSSIQNSPKKGMLSGWFSTFSRPSSHSDYQKIPDVRDPSPTHVSALSSSIRPYQSMQTAFAPV